MAVTESLTASLEDYLEAIFHLAARDRAARARDIADRLNVSRSSVTGALRALGEKGLINYEPYEVITLTAEGETTAEAIVRRHAVLRHFLVSILCIDPDEADRTACQLEHAIRPRVLERLVQFVRFVETCPRGGHEWLKGLRDYCEQGAFKDCEQCLLSCLQKVRDNKARLQR
jgi:DtxR family Mn-dependent transcriptional regulator